MGTQSSTKHDKKKVACSGNCANDNTLRARSAPQKCFTKELRNCFSEPHYVTCKVFFAVRKKPATYRLRAKLGGEVAKRSKEQLSLLSCSFSLAGVRWRNVSQLSQRNAYRTVGFLSDICETAILAFWVVKTHLSKCFSGAERALDLNCN